MIQKMKQSQLQEELKQLMDIDIIQVPLKLKAVNVVVHQVDHVEVDKDKIQKALNVEVKELT